VICVLCGVLLLLSARVGRNHNSGWILLTAPDAHSAQEINSLYGYSYLLGRAPFMKENVPSVWQVAFFSGAENSEKVLDFYALRCGYTSFATALTPLVGTMNALALTNWLAGCLCVWSVWKLCGRLFKDRFASSFAAVTAALGMGLMVHIGDYSAHLSAFATYYLGVYLIYTSGVLYKRRPLRTHLILGAYCACACLVYKSGLMLFAVYLLASLRHNRWLHLAGAAVLALSALPVWSWSLKLLGANFLDTEADYLYGSVQEWQRLVYGSWHQPILAVLLNISQFLLFDSPLIVALGLVSMFWLPHRRGLRWFGILVVGLPIASALVFAQTAMARGYLVYGISIWFYCWLARLVASLWRQDGRWRKGAAFAVMSLVLGSHAAWTTAHWWKQLGPIKTYFLGWDSAWFYFPHGPMRVLSLTDGEPTPRLWGGEADCEEAGAACVPSSQPFPPSHGAFGRALARRLVGAIYLTSFLLLLAASLRRRIAVGLGAVAILLILSALSARTFRQIPTILDIDGQFVLHTKEKISWQTRLGPLFARALAKEVDDGELRLFMLDRGPAELKVHVYCDATPLSLTELAGHHHWQIGKDSALAALRTGSQLTIEVENRSDDPVFLGGWQRATLPGRRLIRLPEHLGGQVPVVLPAMELRLVRKDKTIALIGF
jgi:hypothetical protein